MKANDYKQIIKEENILDFGTLKVTKEQLEKVGDIRLAYEIERIIKENKIDLVTDDIETIVDMFGELEVGALGVDYEPTLSALYYVNLLDKWNGLPDYR